ncbi:CHASE2 domain-containing protein [Marinoscillum sp. 108]|uniref:CHASE2 domain-containing protein n=1 Tax=Marinoscillum sp. 108 TaxID=2653151 RepID=UPI0012F2196C|nr:CHASE2 domain-containing protein [Marinoscillum sp. 108]VXD16859.1 CHASE2 domain-containing sensor protein [Marinoscillum sp. 108]
MFRKFWLDVILGTAFIFGMMGVFQSFTAFKVFDVFDPIGQAFGDMEFTDIVFSQLRDDPVGDDRVVLVNLSNLQRGEIGMMLQIISQHNPAVIGIDSFFYTPKEDTLGDMMLMEGMASVEHLVLASKLLPDPTDPTKDTIEYSWELFNSFAERTAFVNLVTDAEVQEDLKMCREFYPKFDIGGEQQIAFAVQLASYLDSAAAADFLARNNETEVINYRGNVLDYGATKFGNKYFALDVPDVFGENFVPDMIEGKIVMFCYLGKHLGDRESFEDKFYTPLNQKYIGRAFPDMYGGVVHANIISMILNRDYINSMSENMGYVFAILICFFNVALFSLVYKKIPKWYDGITKLFQLLEIGVLVFGVIYILELYSFKADIAVGMVAVALAGDALEVYYGVVKNSFTKEGRKSLFKVDKL